MPQTLEEKQTYLRENILEKGYDGERFMYFCKQKYGEIDINTWSITFLQKIVESFLSVESQTINNENNACSQFPPEMKKQPPTIVFTQADWEIFLGNGENQKNKANKKEQEKSTTKISKKSQPSMKVVEMPELRKINSTGTMKIITLKAKEIPQIPEINKITIIKTEQKSKNFLQGDYTLYHIKFSPCNYVIHKKFNHFRKLRIILQKLYPHIRLPYLQPEGWLVNSSQIKDQQTLAKYKHMIVQFLNYITIKNQALKKSKVVRVFLGMLEENDVDFKKYENIPKPKKFHELCLPQGQLKFNQFQSLIPVDKYMNNTQLLVADIDTHYQKLRKTLQTLSYNFDQVNKSINDVTGIFQSLEQVINRFNFQNDSNKDLLIYEGIKEVCRKMTENISSQYDIFKVKIHNLFRYERQNMTTMKEINDIRSRMFTQYQKQGLPSKKQPNKGEIDLSIPIEELCRSNKQVLRIQNMLWSHYSVENMTQYWKQLRHKINEQLTMIAYDNLDAENQNLNFWNKVIKKCVI